MLRGTVKTCAVNEWVKVLEVSEISKGGLLSFLLYFGLLVLPTIVVLCIMERYKKKRTKCVHSCLYDLEFTLTARFREFVCGVL